MFILSPRPGLAPFRRLTHGFTMGYFRTRLPALKFLAKSAAEYAAPTEFWFWAVRGLQRCRAYGAGRGAFDFSGKVLLPPFYHVRLEQWSWVDLVRFDNADRSRHDSFCSPGSGQDFPAFLFHAKNQ